MFVVIFAIIVILSGWYTWQYSVQSEVAGYSNCYQLKSYIYDNSSSPNTYTQWEIGKQECLANYPIHGLLDFSFGVIVAIITFYFFQVVYYKVLLYIIFGSKPVKNF